MKKILLIATVLLAAACHFRQQRLTEGQIQALFWLCPDDTLYCKGYRYNFLVPKEFDYGAETIPVINVGHYFAAADILGIKYDKGVLGASDANNLIQEVQDSIHAIYIRTRKPQESQIAIPHTFSPKIALTSDIEAMKLADMVYSYYSRTNNQEVMDRVRLNCIDSKPEWKRTREEKLFIEKHINFGAYMKTAVNRELFEYFPESKNLTKICFLQNPKEFIQNNYQYCFRIKEQAIKHKLEAIEAAEKDSQAAIKKSWEQYL